MLVTCIETAPSDHGSNHQLLLNWVESEHHGDRSNESTSLPAIFQRILFYSSTALLTSSLVNTIRQRHTADMDAVLHQLLLGSTSLAQIGRIGAGWCARSAYVIGCRVGVFEELMASRGDPCQLHGQTPLKGGPVLLGGN